MLHHRGSKRASFFTSFNAPHASTPNHVKHDTWNRFEVNAPTHCLRQISSAAMIISSAYRNGVSDGGTLSAESKKNAEDMNGS